MSLATLDFVVLAFNAAILFGVALSVLRELEGTANLSEEECLVAISDVQFKTS